MSQFLQEKRETLEPGLDFPVLYRFVCHAMTETSVNGKRYPFPTFTELYEYYVTQYLEDRLNAQDVDEMVTFFRTHGTNAFDVEYGHRAKHLQALDEPEFFTYLMENRYPFELDGKYYNNPHKGVW